MLPGLKLRFDDILNSGMVEGTPEHRIQNWRYFIKTYTSCSLTFATDRRVAIKGLAKEVQRAWNQTLLYGLWSHHLANELLWIVTDPAKERQDSPDSRRELIKGCQG
jgi:hypothetical protein